MRNFLLELVIFLTCINRSGFCNAISEGRVLILVKRANDYGTEPCRKGSLVIPGERSVLKIH